MFQFLGITFTTAAAIFVVPYRGLVGNKRYLQVIQDQRRSPSSYPASYSSDPKRDSNSAPYIPYSSRAISNHDSSYIGVAPYPSTSSYNVGASIRVGSSYPANSGYSGNQHVLASASSIPAQYSQEPVPQASESSFAYSPYYGSQVSSESAQIANYEPNQQSLPFSQGSNFPIGMLNQDPYEVFSAINPNIRLEPNF